MVDDRCRLINTEARHQLEIERLPNLALLLGSLSPVRVRTKRSFCGSPNLGGTIDALLLERPEDEERLDREVGLSALAFGDLSFAEKSRQLLQGVLDAELALLIGVGDLLCPLTDREEVRRLAALRARLRFQGFDEVEDLDGVRLVRICKGVDDTFIENVDLVRVEDLARVCAFLNEFCGLSQEALADRQMRLERGA